jgi:hypothetical protein
MSDSDSSALFKSRAKELSAFMNAGAEHSGLWRPDELAAVFRHQMSVPMLVDLGTLDLRANAKLRIMSEARGLLLKSFADLFQHPTPPIELLELVKDFAKANLDHPESGLPTEIASVLYYASISAALVRLDRRISKLPDAELAPGLRWAGQQPWLDDNTKSLFAAALEKVSGPPKGGIS